MKQWRKLRIIAQLSVVLGVINILSCIFIFYNVSKSSYGEILKSIDTIIEPKENSIGGRAEQMLKVSLPYLTQYWEEHAQEIRASLQSETILSDFLNEYLEANDMLLGSEEYLYALYNLEEEEFWSLTQEEQLILATYAELFLQVFGVQYLENLNLQEIFIYKGGEGGLSYLNVQAGKDYNNLGMKDIPCLVSNEEILERVRNRSPYMGKIQRERNEKGDNFYYIGEYTSTLNEGAEVSFYYSYDVTSLIQVTREKIGVITLRLIMAFIIIYGLFLLYIQMMIGIPLKKIYEGMLTYVNTRDAQKTAGLMKKIYTYAEISNAAHLLGELAIKAEQYNQECMQQAVERQRIDSELLLATNIQQDALPKDFPDREEFTLYASMTPAKEVAGDFYDFFFIDEDHLGLVIADVCGKGIPAALFMMTSKIYIQNYCELGYSPAEAIRRANTAISNDNPNMMFVTVWYGCLEISTGHVVTVNAGHEYPLIKKNGQGFAYQETKHDRFLGFFPGAVYHEYDFYLEKDETLFVYTDGLPEARSASNEMYGPERLLAVINENPEGTPSELADIVWKDINAFVGRAPQFDDLTLLCVKYHGPQGGKESAGKVGQDTVDLSGVVRI